MIKNSFKLGKILMGIGLVLILLGLYIEQKEIIVWIYFTLIGLVIVFIGAYYFGKCESYNKFILKEDVRINSWTDIIKNYFGRGALGGLIFSLISKYTLLESLSTILFFEIGILFFYYIYYKMKKAKRGK